MSERMKVDAGVCGFSFGKNISKLKYPVEEAVRSVLPLCDWFVYAAGESDDDTVERIERLKHADDLPIPPERFVIVQTTWPEVQIDGTVLAIEANKALDAAEEVAAREGLTWGFYIQGDEVIHEDDLPLIKGGMNHWAAKDRVKGLQFWYHHFVLDYDTVDPWMYHKACRVMRMGSKLQIFGDACGPGMPWYEGKKNDGYLDKHHMDEYVQWAAAPNERRRARVFHYGWVKSKADLDEKFQMVEKLWWGTLSEEEKERRKNNKFGQFIERYPILKKFTQSHPKLMQKWIENHERFATVPNRWLNPRFYAEVLRHGFHG
ncbi:hypothetical protein [Poriferisphaera sp. WC338]|uniref:hypothetical protein n=1 Tax=Poriferisphaera sp. WC338 TaxID=3425129 RepID=UPI003D8127B6